MSKAQQKAGARHSASDQTHLQTIHDAAQALGADCPGAGKFAKAGAIKGMGDAPGLRSASARACWSCTWFQRIEGDYDITGQCRKFDFSTHEYWVCDAWEERPTEPLQVVIVTDAGAKSAPAAVDTPVLRVPTYVKSLHLPHSEQFIKDVLAVKATGRDDIHGYIALWGNPDLVDLETEFFTPQTDFWKSVLGAPRPLTWNHAQDRDAFKAHEVIGKLMEFGDDEVGMFYNAVLDRAHRYRQAVDGLISQRAVGTSSDSAPQYVVREKTKNGAVWLKQWPLFAAALTDVPCEPRMIDVGNVYWKSVGVDPQALQPQTAEATAQSEAARDEQQKRLTNAQRHHDLLNLYLED